MIYTKLEGSLKKKSKDKIIKDYIDLYKKKEKLEQEKEKLERELKKYKNANTPSSANKHLKPDTEGLKAEKGAKRGAPKGHKGNTLILTPQRIIELIDKFCQKCRSKNLKLTGSVKKQIVICLQKAKTIIKQYNRYEYLCLDCREVSLSTHKDLPEKGIYDKTIQSLVNYYRSKSRLTYNLIVDTMNNVHNVPMTEPTSLDIIQRVSKKLEPLYQNLEQDVKKADLIQGDETGHSVNGTNNWVWVFCNQKITLFKFNKERGGDIVERTLGKEFKGKLVSDGWRTYLTYSEDNNIIQQRCWDHPKREAKHECKKKHPELYKWFCDIYFDVKKGKEYKQTARRIKMHKKCKAQLQMLISSMKAHKNLKKLATKIENGGDAWFNCILYPELPMDNNEAERSLRPLVVMRKIIGCLRSDRGVRAHEIMMSLTSTWKKQGKNVFYTLQNTL